jgi:uncharacterized protein YfiM (DUF2279 family)
MRAFALVLSLWMPGGARGRERAPGDSRFSRDKVEHFFVSAFVQSVSYSVLRTAHASREDALVGASAMTVVVGVGKELHDQRSGENFSVRDLAWDAAGAGAATVLLSRAR